LFAPVDNPTDARAVTQQRDAPVIDYSWTNRSEFVLYRIPSEGGTPVLLLNRDTGESRSVTPGKGVTAWIEKLSPEHVDEVAACQGTGTVEFRVPASQFSLGQGRCRVQKRARLRPGVVR
jgi:hypothetical protein